LRSRRMSGWLRRLDFDDDGGRADSERVSLGSGIRRDMTKTRKRKRSTMDAKSELRRGRAAQLALGSDEARGSRIACIRRWRDHPCGAPAVKGPQAGVSEAVLAAQAQVRWTGGGATVEDGSALRRLGRLRLWVVQSRLGDAELGCWARLASRYACDGVLDAAQGKCWAALT
jgi:hypothetical protein